MSRSDAAPAIAVASPQNRQAQVRAMLKRVAPGLRPAATACAASHPHLEDLLLSFPLALAALAARTKGHDAAVELVRAGAPLKAVVHALAMPMWLRHVPVEAAVGPLPELPLSSAFALQIRNLLPFSHREAANWLSGIAAAYKACDETYAIWAAGRLKETPNLNTEGIKAMGVFAWFSLHGETEAHGHAGRAWSPGLSRAEASDSAYAWLDQLSFATMRAPFNAVAGPEGTVEGFNFVPLTTARDFAEEAAAMSNCLGNYWDMTADGSRQIWSVRREGQRVGCVDVQISVASRGVPELHQIRGPKNEPVTGDILRAVYAWLRLWPDDLDNLPQRWRPVRTDSATYGRLMKPYWQAKGFAPCVPYAPPGDGPFDPLASSIGKLATGRRPGRAPRRRLR